MEHAVILNSQVQQRFNAYAMILFASCLAGLCWLTEILSLFMAAMIGLMLVGAWGNYLYHRRFPTTWKIIVDANCLRYEKNGMIVDQLARVDVRQVRFDRQRLCRFLYLEERPSIKLELKDGSVHCISYLRLYYRNTLDLLIAFGDAWGVELLHPDLHPLVQRN